MKSVGLRIALIVLIIGNLSILSMLPGNASPGEAAWQYWVRVEQNDPYSINEFKILDGRYWVDFTLVLAAFSQNTGKEEIQNISYVITKRGLFGWYARSGQSTGKSLLPDLVLYTVDRKDNEGLVYGQILSTDVAAVEVVFANGETLSDSGTNGSFAILFPESWQFAELRLRDREGNIFQIYNQLNSLD